MALSDNYVPTKVTGDGMTTVFTGDWDTLAAAFFRLYLEDKTTGVQTLQTQGVDYTLSFTSSGWTATFNTAPASTVWVIGARVTTQEQTIPYKTARGFQGPVHEGSYDRLTAMIQEQQDAVGRALKFQLGSTTSAVVPEPVANYILGWNSTATALENKLVADIESMDIVSEFMATFLDDSTETEGRATLGAQEDVITTRGDIVRGSSAGAAERLAVGTAGQVLKSDGTDAGWDSNALDDLSDVTITSVAAKEIIARNDANDGYENRPASELVAFTESFTSSEITVATGANTYTGHLAPYKCLLHPCPSQTQQYLIAAY